MDILKYIDEELQRQRVVSEKNKADEIERFFKTKSVISDFREYASQLFPKLKNRGFRIKTEGLGTYFQASVGYENKTFLYAIRDRFISCNIGRRAFLEPLLRFENAVRVFEYGIKEFV